MFFRSRSSSDDDEMCLRNVTRKPDSRIEEKGDDEDMAVDEDWVEPPKKDIEIRKDFPETWLFDNLEFTK